MKRYLLILILIMNIVGFATESKLIIISEIQKPGDILIDESRIYITEGASVYIYSIKDAKMIKKFGKKGEGPQEFKLDERQMADLFLDVSTQNIIAQSMGKISWFTKNGKFIKEMKFNITPALSGTKKFGENFIGMFITQNKKRFRGLRAYGKDQQMVKEIVKKDDVFQFGKGMDVFKYSSANAVYNDKLFVAWGTEFVIDVFDSNFNILKTIKYPYKRVKVKESDKKKILDFYKKDPTTRDYYNILKPFKFASYFPAIRNLFVSRDKLYVVTNKKKKDDTELLVFTSEGVFIKQVFFPLKMATPSSTYPYVIYENVIYQLEEDIEAEEWKIRITKI